MHKAGHTQVRLSNHGDGVGYDHHAVANMENG
jgi:hypothetical protein